MGHLNVVKANTDRSILARRNLHLLSGLALSFRFLSGQRSEHQSRMRIGAAGPHLGRNLDSFHQFFRRRPARSADFV